MQERETECARERERQREQYIHTEKYIHTYRVSVQEKEIKERQRVRVQERGIYSLMCIVYLILYVRCVQLAVFDIVFAFVCYQHLSFLQMTLLLLIDFWY